MTHNEASICTPPTSSPLPANLWRARRLDMGARTQNADGVRDDVKESTRWIEGYERVAEPASALPQTRQVYVVDRRSRYPGFIIKARDLGHAADYLILLPA